MNKQPLNTAGQYGNVMPVTAKSVTRIGLRNIFKAYSRIIQRFFCTVSAYLPDLMAGLLGASSEAPGSLKTGKTNPDNSATIPDIGLSLGGSQLQGAYPMAITCRLALLEGNNPRLSACRIRYYCTRTYNSPSEARRAAVRLNALICGWNICVRQKGVPA